MRPVDRRIDCLSEFGSEGLVPIEAHLTELLVLSASSLSSASRVAKGLPWVLDSDAVSLARRHGVGHAYEVISVG